MLQLTIKYLLASLCVSNSFEDSQGLLVYRYVKIMEHPDLLSYGYFRLVSLSTCNCVTFKPLCEATGISERSNNRNVYNIN